MPNLFDVSHVTGTSTSGATNNFLNFHSAVNNQVPFYLSGKAQKVKPSVSLNAATNVLFAGSPNKTSTAPLAADPRNSPGSTLLLPAAITKPRQATPAELEPTPEEEDKPWYYDAALWFTKNWALPFVRNAVADPVGTTVRMLNPTMAIPTIIGKGDPLAGTFAILDVPGKVVTSTLINVGRTSQLIRQGIEGTDDTTDYWADMGNAWNWSLHDSHYAFATDAAGEPIYETDADGKPKQMLDETGMPMFYKYEDGTDALDAQGNKMPMYEQKQVDLHDNIDIGTAFVYALGQTVGIATTTPVAAFVSQEDKDMFNNVMTDWGLIATTTNFDIFSQEQRDKVTGVQRAPGVDGLPGAQIEGTGNGWTFGNVVTQTMNLVGDLATDPLTYVPFGKVGRVAFAGRNLLTSGAKTQITKNVIKDATTLADAAAGNTTVYSNFLNFVAKNNATTISNHVVIKSMTTGERDHVAFLLGQVTKPEDAAKVLLAVEYGSVRAQKELLRDYGKVSVALDAINGGGYLTRAINEGKLLPQEGMLDIALHTNFYNELMMYSDDIAKSTFGTVLRDTAYQISDEGISAATKTLREITPANVKNLFLNKLVNQIEAKGAKVGTFFVNGVTDAGHIALERPFRYGSPSWILHQIIRVGSKSAKGMIDVSNIDGVATGKFYGALNDVDRVTMGRLSMTTAGQPSVKQVLTEQWLASGSALERAKILEDLNRVGMNLLVEKHGADDAVKQLLTDELMKRRDIFANNLDKSGLHILTQDGKQIVYHDPYAVGKGNTEVHMWNWNKADAAFIKNKSIVANATLGTADTLASLYGELNGLFNALVVTRGSRLFRDVIANTVTTFGSGHAADMFKYIHPIDAIKQNVSKIPRIGDMAKRISIRKGNVKDTVGAISKLEEERSVLADVVGTQYQYIVDQLATVPMNATTYSEITAFLMANKVIKGTPSYHYTLRPITKVDENRVLISFANPTEAAEEAAEKFAKPLMTYLPTAEQLAMPDSAGRALTSIEDIVLARPKEIVQVRAKGRNREWEEYNAASAPIDTSKYEYRSFTREQFQMLSLDDLTTMANDPVKGYFLIGPVGNMFEITPEYLAKYGFPKPGVQIFETPVKGGVSVQRVNSFSSNDGWDMRGNMPGQNEKELQEFFESVVNSPTREREDSLLSIMKEYNIARIIVNDSKGRPVIINNPAHAIVAGSEEDLGKILSKSLDDAGFGFVERGSKGNPMVAEDIFAATGRAPIGDTPLIPPYIKPDMLSKDVIKMPQGWSIFKAEKWSADSPKFLVKIGGVDYGIGFAVDGEGKLIWYFANKANQKKALKNLDPKESQIQQILGNIRDAQKNTVSKKDIPLMYFRLNEKEALTIGDFIPVTQIRGVTRKSTENIAKMSNEQRALLEAQTNFGTFDGQTLARLNGYRTRLEEIDYQLFYLMNNLRFVTGKLSKKEAAQAADAQARLSRTLNIPVKPNVDRVPTTSGNADIDALFADMDWESTLFPKQQFSDALLGKNGKTWYAKIQKDSAEVRARGTGFFTATDNVVNKVVKPGEKGYWEAWQRTLNEHWRSKDGTDLDPSIRKILQAQVDGITDEQIAKDLVTWMKTSPEGIRYAKEIGVGPEFADFNHGIYRRPKTRFEQMTYEDYVEMQMANVSQHVGIVGKVPDSGDVINEMLETGFGVYSESTNIALKLLRNQPITVEDLVRANLREPRDFRGIDEIIINRETGKAEALNLDRDFKNLPEIWGTMSDPIARRGIIEKGKYYLTQFNRATTDIPQEILFQKPMFRVAYAKSLERQSTQMRIATGRDYFNQAELTAMEEKARSFALQETRKYVYSSTVERNIMNGIRQVVPFANATVFTAKWMANVIKERPVYAAWMVYEYNKAINGVNWFDKNGNIVDYNAKGEDGKPLATHFRFDYPPELINILAGKAPNDPWAKNYVSKTFVSRTSVDPIWNGNNISLFGVQVPNPFVNWGLSPAPAMLASELIKASYTDPNGLFGKIGQWVKDMNDSGSKSGLTPDLLPYGVSPDPLSLGLLIPGQAAKMIVDDQALLKLKLNAATFLWGQYSIDPEGFVSRYGKKPDDAMINSVAGGLVDLKNRTSFFMPFATKYVTQADIARSTWQTYLENEQEAFDLLGPEEYTRRNIPGFLSYEERKAQLPGARPNLLDPFTVAQSKFLHEHSDLFFGALSQSGGDLKISPQLKTGENLRRYGNLIPDLTATEEGADVASDVINGKSSSSTGNEPYVFDENVYNLLIERKLVAKSDPNEMGRKVMVAQGNKLFRKGVDLPDGTHIMGMNELDNLSFERNIPIDSDPYLFAQKQLLIRTITNKEGFGSAWAEARSSVNPQRYNNLAESWGLVKDNPTWKADTMKSNPTFWESVDAYLDDRAEVQAILAQRAVRDPKKGLLSNNPDLQIRIRNNVYYLKNDYDKSGKFSEWYNNYFEGDTIN
jgi:hypothetical protein